MKVIIEQMFPRKEDCDRILLGEVKSFYSFDNILEPEIRIQREYCGQYCKQPYYSVIVESLIYELTRKDCYTPNNGLYHSIIARYGLRSSFTFFEAASPEKFSFFIVNVSNPEIFKLESLYLLISDRHECNNITWI